MTVFHKELAGGRWRTFPFIEQMANVGSEIERAMAWRKRGSVADSAAAFERGLELLDLTIQDPGNRKRLRELCRLREALADYFVGENTYRSTDELWRNYFYSFAYAARRERE
ncbi:MAG TPA: hypothetical protein VLH40_03065 [Atribacteraceae bacterium]|nr:hypothetical protein [Atribacteraceae bacterium]